MGTAIVSTSQGRDDRPRGPRSGRRRRGRRVRLVAAMSRIGRKPIPVPAGVDGHDRARARVASTARRGELSRAHLARHRRSTQDGDSSLVTRPTDRGEHRALHGLTRSLVANMVEGVTNGYAKTLEIQGVGYRARSRARTSSSRSATRTRSPSTRRRASSSRCRSPRASIVKGISKQAGRRDRRQHPQAASAGALQGQGHPLRGRVRRPEGREARMSVDHEGAAAPAPPPPRAREGHRHRRAPADLASSAPTAASPRSSSTTSAATRSPRSAGPRPTLRELEPMEQAAKAGQAARRARQGRGRRAPRSSIAAATSTTAASRPSPRASARAASTVYRERAASMAIDRTVSPAGLDLQERVVEINRVAKVVKGGRRFSFTALVVVGDEKDVVGVGYGKANEVPLAIQKGVEQAKKNLFRVPKHGATITHQTTGIFGSEPRLPQARLARYRRHRRRRRARGARARRASTTSSARASARRTRSTSSRRRSPGLQAPAHARARSPQLRGLSINEVLGLSQSAATASTSTAEPHAEGEPRPRRRRGRREVTA